MLQVALAASEVEIIAKQFVAGLGRAEDWDPEEFDCVVSVIPAFKFPIFLAVLESKYAVDQDPLTLVEAVRELQDHFLHDVLRKGRLGKQMDYLPLARYYIIILYIIYYNITTRLGYCPAVSDQSVSSLRIVCYLDLSTPDSYSLSTPWN